MLGKQNTAGRIAQGSAVALVVLLTGCGYAKRKDVDNELARLRQEMQQGDQELGARVDRLDGRVNALEGELQALRKDFNVTVERLEGMLSFDVPVHFDFDRATVRDQDKAVLDRFAAVVRSYYPNAVVTVEGFADPAGNQAYNLKLGKARAEAVRAYLTTAGNISPNNIRAVSYGEARDRQVVPGASGEAGLPNRRVSLVIDYSDKAPAPAGRPVTLNTSGDN